MQGGNTKRTKKTTKESQHNTGTQEKIPGKVKSSDQSPQDNKESQDEELDEGAETEEGTIMEPQFAAEIQEKTHDEPKSDRREGKEKDYEQDREAFSKETQSKLKKTRGRNHEGIPAQHRNSGKDT